MRGWFISLLVGLLSLSAALCIAALEGGRLQLATAAAIAQQTMSKALAAEQEPRRLRLDELKQWALQERKLGFALTYVLSLMSNSGVLPSRPDISQLLRTLETNLGHSLPYHNRIIELADELPHNKSVSLEQFLQPLFNLAQERAFDGGDAIAENRAAVVALALYTNRIPVDRLIGTAQAQQQTPARRVTLGGRRDLAQHFLISAAITALADERLAFAAGLFKEMDDSRGGSGFSFADLAADRAGIRFGKAATASDRQARQFQRLVSAGIIEADIMPKVNDLPEALTEAEFNRRYGGVDGAGYRQMVLEIDQRIAECRAYR